MNVALTIKMKCWILLVVLIFLICGCSPSHQQENDSIPLISVSHLFEREYIELQKQYVDWSVWGDNIYLLDETGLDCYSDTAGTIRETSISGGRAIDVYDNEKFVIAQDGITVYPALKGKIQAIQYTPSIAQYWVDRREKKELSSWSSRSLDQLLPGKRGCIRYISVENTTRKSTAKAIRKKSEMNPMESITRTAEAAALYAAPEIVTTAQASQ